MSRRFRSRLKPTPRPNASWPRLNLEALEDRCTPATFTVTNTLDDGSAGSLRWAITQANSTPNLSIPDVIDFAIAGGGPRTIALGSALPSVTEAVLIDGYTQSGASANTQANGTNAILNVVLDGTSAGIGVNGLTLSGHFGSTIKGLVIQDFDGAGVLVSAGGTHFVSGNFLGTDATGTSDAGNQGGGVFVTGGATGVVVGGSVADRNLISGNGTASVPAAGVLITGSTTSSNAVKGNIIGLNASGMAALGNQSAGVLITGGAGSNTVGGASLSDTNVISGNNAGVVIDGASNNFVVGNLIGTDATGARSGVGNTTSGVGVKNGADNNTIGGSAGNLIADNGGAGVTVTGVSTTGNSILGNRIFANAGIGIDLEGNGISPLSSIGSFTPSGPNNLQNYPVLTSYASNQVAGVLTAAKNTTFRIEFFRLDPTSSPGMTLITFVNVTTNSIANGAGQATFSNVDVGSLPAGAIVVATATNLNTGDTSELSAGTPASLTVAAGDGQSTPVNTSFSSPLRVEVRDGQGRDVQGIDVTFTLPSSPGLPGGVLAGPNTVVTNASGIADSGLVTANGTGGGWIATAAVAGLGSVNLSLTNIGPGVIDHFTFTGLGPVVDAGQPVLFTLSARDSANTLITNYTGTVRFASTDFLTLLPGDYTFDQMDGGQKSFTATFPRGGFQSVTVTDITMAIGSQRTFNVDSPLSSHGVLLVPIAGVPFTQVVATFSDEDGTGDVSQYFASINWGDGGEGQPGQIVALTATTFVVRGTFTYTTADTYLVSVEIAKPAAGLIEIAEGAAVVLTGPQSDRLGTFGFDQARPGDPVVSATTTGIDALLLDLSPDDDFDETLFVATYTSNPEADPVDGTAFYDVRVTGSEPADQLIVNFAYPPEAGPNPQLLYYDEVAGKYLPAVGSRLIPNSLTNDPVNRILRVVFDASSTPALQGLRGTVFTIVVGSPTSPTVTFDAGPSQAIALTSTTGGNGTVTDVSGSRGRGLSFQGSSTLTVALATGVDGSASLGRAKFTQAAENTGAGGDEANQREILDLFYRVFDRVLGGLPGTLRGFLSSGGMSSFWPAESPSSEEASDAVFARPGESLPDTELLPAAAPIGTADDGSKWLPESLFVPALALVLCQRAEGTRRRSLPDLACC